MRSVHNEADGRKLEFLQSVLYFIQICGLVPASNCVAGQEPAPVRLSVYIINVLTTVGRAKWSFRKRGNHAENALFYVDKCCDSKPDFVFVVSGKSREFLSP